MDAGKLSGVESVEQKSAKGPAKKALDRLDIIGSREPYGVKGEYHSFQKPQLETQFEDTPNHPKIEDTTPSQLQRSPVTRLETLQETWPGLPALYAAAIILIGAALADVFLQPFSKSAPEFSPPERSF